MIDDMGTAFVATTTEHMELTGGAGKMTGKMKSFSYKSGYGFIHDVPGAPADIYVGKDQLPIEWQLSDQRLDGQEVMFDVQHMMDGKMHAKNVVATTAPLGGQTVSGTVKTYNPHKGYGFFVVEGLGEDVFFSSVRIPVEVAQQRLDGTDAVFNLQQKPDGKYEAYNIQLTNAQAFARTMPDLGGLGNNKRPFTTISAGDNHIKRQRLTQQVVAQPLIENVLYNGAIKSYRQQTNYGFIVCQQAAGDLRFHQNDVVNGQNQVIEEGQEVSFYARSSPEGRLQAYNVTILGVGFEGAKAQKTKRENMDPVAALDGIRELLPTLGPMELTKLHSLVGQLMLGCNDNVNV